MPIIGQFHRDGDSLVGHITTMSFQHKAVLVPNPRKRGKNPAEYLVFANGVHLGEARFPSGNARRHFLCVVLDDPIFAASIACKLVDQGCGSYRLEWSR